MSEAMDREVTVAMDRPDTLPTVEVIDGSTDIVRAQDAAAMDVQVATAKRYPRSLQLFESDLETWATRNETAARQCFYVKPIGGGSVIGASVRFAELVQTAYGNLAVDARVIAIEHDRIIAEGTCRDLQRNTFARSQVSRSILDRNRRRYANSVIETNIAAALAIARRNAIFQVVPKALWEQIYDKARLLAEGEGESFTVRRNKTIKALTEKGCVTAHIKAFFGGRELKDLVSDDVIAMRLKLEQIDGGLEPGKAFPEPRPDENDAQAAASDVAAALDNAKKKENGDAGGK